jgi:hypothetical protein
VHQGCETKPAPDDQMQIQAYAARRSYAFDVAETAYWEHRICADAYMLFRLLTRLCKERIYCWPGLNYLAERLQTSIGTIKRRLDKLERAELIERKQRPGGLTSYTYVLPLQRYDAGQSTPQDVSVPSDQQLPIAQVEAAEVHLPHLSQGDRALESYASFERPSDPLFFAPNQGINLAPSDRSELIQQTVKSQNLIFGGGRDSLNALHTATTTETCRILEQAGVVSPSVLYELKNMPISQVAACLQFARRQRNIADPAAFAVSLLRLGLGEKLLHRSQHSFRQGNTTESNVEAYGHYHCEHGNIRGTGCTDCEQGSGVCGDPKAPKERPPQRGRGAVLLNGRSSLWTSVLDLLQSQFSADEFETWLRPTSLIKLDADVALIGTPNIFARERVAGEYSELIAQALCSVVDHRVQVSVVLDTSLNTM